MSNNGEEISIRVPDALLDKMDVVMGGEYLTKGEFIRMAIYHLLEDYKDELKTEKENIKVDFKSETELKYDDSYHEEEVSLEAAVGIEDDLDKLNRLKKELLDI